MSHEQTLKTKERTQLLVIVFGPLQWVTPSWIPHGEAFSLDCDVYVNSPWIPRGSTVLPVTELVVANCVSRIGGFGVRENTKNIFSTTRIGWSSLAQQLSNVMSIWCTGAGCSALSDPLT